MVTLRQVRSLEAQSRSGFSTFSDKGVISRSDALGILKEAQGFLKDSPGAIDGSRVVGSIYERILKGN